MSTPLKTVINFLFSDYPAAGRDLFTSYWNSFAAACIRYL